ncbi:kell blood group glycoprotein [Tachyglossus aculeatus]|uniref:kell blood group glycoprotein n=1 Tax=Tachyglossus aculeatus TaxID=9261 RepID=UPI0018F5C5EF|nr:kell blood group glycoprotein [Tachyglossus aculeatus]
MDAESGNSRDVDRDMESRGETQRDKDRAGSNPSLYRARRQQHGLEEASPQEQSRRWSPLGRTLGTLVFFGLLVAFSVLMVYNLLGCSPRPCQSPACTALLARYSAASNASVSPCADFYSFACGGWGAGDPPGVGYSTFRTLEEENHNRLQKLLEAAPAPSPGSAAEKALGYYRSCMDTVSIETQGIGPLSQVIQQLGGWRIAGPWRPPNLNQTLKLLMSEYGSFPFFRAYLGPSPEPPHELVIQIDQPELMIPSQDSQGNYPQMLRAYLAYLTRLGTLLGGTPDVAGNHASMSLSISSMLQKELRSLEERRAGGRLFQPTTVAQLQKEVPIFDWLSCLRATFSPMPLEPSQTLVVHDLDYLKGAAQVIQQLQEQARGSDALQSHMLLGLVGTVSPALDSRFQEARRNLSRQLRALDARDPQPPVPRWRKCVQETGTFFEPVLGPLFARHAFGPDTSHHAAGLFSEVRDALLRRLQRLQWLDEDSRARARDTVASLRMEMGAPEEMLKLESVDQDYQDVQLGPSFLQTVLSCMRSLQARKMRRVLQGSRSHRWQVPPWAVSSYYSVSDHVVIFPAGLLQPPFFHPGYPRAVNFGAAGSIMAHELLHVFYHLLLPGGCPSCDRTFVQEALRCLRLQYEGLRATPDNSSRTLLEDSADVGALTIALQAYRRHLQLQRGETTLPDLGISPRQLFFLSFAHVMCGRPQPEDPRETHSPPPLRVRVPLSNAPAFARHFNCPPGTPLNPLQRCKLW